MPPNTGCYAHRRYDCICHSRLVDLTYVVAQAPPDHATAEDCLNLNILRPVVNTVHHSSPLPVLVWIYGGGFQREPYLSDALGLSAHWYFLETESLAYNGSIIVANSVARVRGLTLGACMHPSVLTKVLGYTHHLCGAKLPPRSLRIPARCGSCEAWRLKFGPQGPNSGPGMDTSQHRRVWW